jgi:hypothetical protein
MIQTGNIKRINCPFNDMKKVLISLLLTCPVYAFAQKTVQVLEVPGKSSYAAIHSDHFAVLPSGRYVKPAGELVRITHDPVGIFHHQHG